jgi:hypothetical protein
MNQPERERKHQASLERINQVQRVAGRGDRMRVDHEGTVLDRARMMMEEMRSHEATELGLAAFDRLLKRAEGHEPRGSREIAQFIHAVWFERPLPLATLRGLDSAIADDMMAVLDAFRYARLNLAEHVEGGPERLVKLLDKRSLADA